MVTSYNNSKIFKKVSTNHNVICKENVSQFCIPMNPVNIIISSSVNIQKWCYLTKEIIDEPFEVGHLGGRQVSYSLDYEHYIPILVLEISLYQGLQSYRTSKFKCFCFYSSMQFLKNAKFDFERKECSKTGPLDKFQFNGVLLIFNQTAL